MKLPDEHYHDPLCDLLSNKKKNASYFSLVEFGTGSYEINYHFGERLEGHYWIMIIRGRIVDFETKENEKIYVNALPTGLMGEVLGDVLKRLDTDKFLELTDILFS